MSRRWLVGVSLVAHAAVGVGLFVSGVWRIERVEAGRQALDLVRPLAPPEPAPGGPVAARLPDFRPKERKPPVVKVTVQPPVVTPDLKPETGEIRGPDGGGGDGPGDPKATGTCVENCPDSEPTDTRAPDPVCGDGVLAAGEQCDDRNTITGDGCSSTCRTETRTVAPNVLGALRISGETQVHPSTATQNMMLRDNTRSVLGIVQVCLASNGTVASASMLRPTGYDGYDATLLAAVRGWRYRPYMINRTPIAACSTVSFHYSIQ